jgi:hypothetical protein
MTLDRTHMRTLGRYRLMFQTSVSSASIGAVLSILGLLAWTFGPMPEFLPWSMFMVWLAVLLGYKVVLSTSRLLEAEGGHSLD